MSRTETVVTAADLYHSTARPREMVAAGRKWLLDAFDDNSTRRVIRLMNAVNVVAKVEQHYDGGWKAFVEAESL